MSTLARARGRSFADAKSPDTHSVMNAAIAECGMGA